VPCYSPLKGYKNASGGWQFRKENSVGKMDVACGSCLGCRLDRSRVWAMRIVHESTMYEYGNGNSFVTLTYSDDAVPEDWSLRKSDFQKFMKRLRKAYPQKIRYFHCGEYGNKCKHIEAWETDRTVKDCPGCDVGRPHYHACLFNISFTDLEPVGMRNSVVYYTSGELQKFWPHGHVQVGELTFESAAYVARYVLKKINGIEQENWYAVTDDNGEVRQVEPEYCSMSLKPGIGAEWYERFKTDIFPSDEVPVPGSGVFKKVPRYYESLLEREDEGLLEEVKALRQAFRAAHEDEYSPERLMQKYKVKKAQVGMLKRGQ
jgi:hypothetical protein